MPKTVGVAVSNATFHFDKLYTYAVMPDQQDAVRLGSMVLVPFGRGSRARMGVVLACDAEPENSKLKFLFDVAPASACLTPELLRLVHFLKERTFCTYYEAVKAVIPYGAQYKPAVAADGVTPVLQKQLVRHTENAYKLVGTLPPRPKPTAKQLAAVALLGGGERTQTELEEKGISRAVLDNLCTKGVLECSKVNKSIDLYASIPLKNEPILLTSEQQAAYDALLPHLEDAATPFGAALRRDRQRQDAGLPQAHRARACSWGGSALVLVPEISLTPQMILPPQEPASAGGWQSQHSRPQPHGTAATVADDPGRRRPTSWSGTRSAMFAPLDEHRPHHHRRGAGAHLPSRRIRAPLRRARGGQAARGRRTAALLLLGSARPPAIESYYAAQHGRYPAGAADQAVRRPRRCPMSRSSDMRAELACRQPARDQSCARRCYPPQSGSGRADHPAAQPPGLPDHRPVCSDCGEVLKCATCSVPMVYHKSAHKLLCHYCGSQLDPPPQKCPACGGTLQYRGFGTQKAEEELAKLLPGGAHPADGHRTTTAAQGRPRKAAGRPSPAGEYDIMVGTQMVAKGLDFPNVTLVGVLGIDHAAVRPELPGVSRACSPLSPRWWAGAAGPEIAGQAHHPDHRPRKTGCSNLAAAQDYDAFFDAGDRFPKAAGSTRRSARCASFGFAGAKESEVASRRPPGSRPAAGRQGGRAAGAASADARPHPRAMWKCSTESTATNSPSSAATTAASATCCARRCGSFTSRKSCPRKATVSRRPALATEISDTNILI